MIVTNKYYNLIPYNSSFLLQQTGRIGLEEDDEETLSMRTGSVFSYADGDTHTVSGDFSEITKEGQYIGIQSSISGLTPTGAALYTSDERLEKKSDDEAFWTWVELISDEGEIFGIESDILMRNRGVSFEDDRETHATLEEFGDGIRLKISYKEGVDRFEDGIERNYPHVVKTFDVFDGGEDVLSFRLSDPEDEDSLPIYELTKLKDYESHKDKEPMAIVNGVEFLITQIKLN